MKLSKRDKKQIEKWIAALRSGEYGQGKGTLNSAPNEFCCLGVACKLYDKKPLYYTCDNHKLMAGSFPTFSSHKKNNIPKWLHEINEDFCMQTGYSLSQLNDSGLTESGNAFDRERFTFEEIADLIEAVYLRKVL